MTVSKNLIWGWFGDKPKPPIYGLCKATWDKHLAGWNVIELNERTFDVNFCEYSKQAYAQKAYSYVNDVARLWALHKYGGVYLDTDYYLFRPIPDNMLTADAFCGEGMKGVSDKTFQTSTGIIGAKQGNAAIAKKLSEYTVLKRFSHRIAEWTLDSIRHDVVVHDYTLLTCANPYSEEIEVGDDSIGIHLYDVSWDERCSHLSWARYSKIPKTKRSN